MFCLVSCRVILVSVHTPLSHLFMPPSLYIDIRFYPPILNNVALVSYPNANNMTQLLSGPIILMMSHGCVRLNCGDRPSSRIPAEHPSTFLRPIFSLPFLSSLHRHDCPRIDSAVYDPSRCVWQCGGVSAPRPEVERACTRV